MDIVLAVCDNLFFDKLYATVLPLNQPLATKPANISQPIYSPRPDSDAIVHDWLGLSQSSLAEASLLARDDVRRQFFSLFLITWIFGALLYFIVAGLSYVFVFDKDTLKHPKFLKNQIRLEMQQTLRSLPFMALLTAPFFTLEVRGYSKLYIDPEKYGTWYMYAQFPLFIVFTDPLIYCIHRGLHLPYFYKMLHKSHHKWIMPTPFASHAFHPVDGWAQSVPYHVFPFIFPLHKFSYVALFVFINIWTVLIHDGEYVANSPIINGAACHTMHHLYFNYNYGQYTTLWDRIGGSYRKPNLELFYRETKMGTAEWERQKKEMEKIVKEVEGDDTQRVYAADIKKTN